MGGDRLSWRRFGRERRIALASSERAQLQAVTLDMLEGEQCRARVKIGRNIGPRLQQSFMGQHQGPWSPLGEMQCSAFATIEAIRRAYKVPEETFTLIGIKTVESFERPAILVRLHATAGQHSQELVGFCEVKADIPTTIAKAVLNGLNRFIQFALVPQS